MTVLSPLVSDLLTEIVRADAAPDLADNVDPSYPAPDLPAEQAWRRLTGLLKVAEGLENLRDLLEDPTDRGLLVRVLAYRVLGPRKVRLPLALDRISALTERARTAMIARDTVDLGFLDWRADDFDLASLGFPVRLRVHIASVVWIFLLEQYRYRGRLEVAAMDGDVVIDGGACWGDTALYFADRVGPQGRVVAFEPAPGNLRLLDHNLAINPDLASRITVRRSALWREAELPLSFRFSGPATRVVVGDPGSAARTETIDAFVEREQLDRVSLIKLDIEGAERDALAGAELTLRRFRPRLALASYHRADDLAALPAYLGELDLGYRFGLTHPSMDHEETMLFARSGQETQSPHGPAAP
jgi:FkbM family methyltransferase